MTRLLDDHRLFWRQFRQNFHTTGAVLPSGRRLAKALARYVANDPQSSSSPARRILEVGPGTGAVTAEIVRCVQGVDRLDLVELNDAFVQRLEERFEREEAFRRIADRARVLHRRVEEVDGIGSYDLIVSGLPLNNFSVEDVREILAAMCRLLRPGGVLSFFEYIAIRQARAIVSGREERARLRGIDAVLAGILQPCEFRREWIWLNVPPAWVHHVRMPA